MGVYPPIAPVSVADYSVRSDDVGGLFSLLSINFSRDRSGVCRYGSGQRADCANERQRCEGHLIVSLACARGKGCNVDREVLAPRRHSLNIPENPRDTLYAYSLGVLACRLNNQANRRAMRRISHAGIVLGRKTIRIGISYVGTAHDAARSKPLSPTARDVRSPSWFGLRSIYAKTLKLRMQSMRDRR